MLNEEQASDEQLQAQFKEKWNRTKSNVLTQVFKVNITKYREIIKNAKSADKVKLYWLAFYIVIDIQRFMIIFSFY